MEKANRIFLVTLLDEIWGDLDLEHVCFTSPAYCNCTLSAFFEISPIYFCEKKCNGKADSVSMLYFSNAVTRSRHCILCPACLDIISSDASFDLNEQRYSKTWQLSVTAKIDALSNIPRRTYFCMQHDEYWTHRNLEMG